MAISKVLDYKNLLAGFMIILVCSMMGCNLYYISLGEVSEADCDAVREFVIGTKFKNIFGNESKLVDAYNMTEVSHTETELICKGEAKMTGFGKENRSIRVVYAEDGNGDKYHDIEFTDSIFD